MNAWLVTGIGVWVALLSRSAVAAPTGEELAVARGLFEQARMAQRQEEWGTCKALVQEALAIVETPGLLFHLAFCREQNGEWVDALAAYERARELLDAGMHAPDVKPLLESAINGLRIRLPRVQLAAPLTESERCELRIDGKLRSGVLTHNAIPMNPGKHVLELNCYGFTPFRRDIELVPGDAPNITVQLRPAADAEAQAPKSDSEDKTALPPRPSVGVVPDQQIQQTAGSKQTAATNSALTPEPAHAASSSQEVLAKRSSASTALLLGASGVAVAGAVVAVVFHLDAERQYQALVEAKGAVSAAHAAPCNGDSTLLECSRVARFEANYRSMRRWEVIGIGAAGVGVLTATLSGLFWPTMNRTEQTGAALTTAFRPRVTGSLAHGGSVWLGIERAW